MNEKEWVADGVPVRLGRIDESPWLALDRTLSEVGDACLRWLMAGFSVRWVSGRQMGGLDGVFAQFAAAWQFPPFFGWNLAAFDECLREVDINQVVPPGRGYVVVLFDAGSVLVGEEPDLPPLVRAMSYAHEVYSKPIIRGEWWDRPALPFHVVLHMGRDHARRWEDAGVSLSWLDQESDGMAIDGLRNPRRSLSFPSTKHATTNGRHPNELSHISCGVVFQN